uniref:Pantothenate synthetase n=1 Tax=Anthurium amnicola TaxID=1678845 RepID=A0A1D1YQI7_9ARAE
MALLLPGECNGGNGGEAGYGQGHALLLAAVSPPLGFIPCQGMAHMNCSRKCREKHEIRLSLVSFVFFFTNIPVDRSPDTLCTQRVKTETHVGGMSSNVSPGENLPRKKGVILRKVYRTIFDIHS